MNEKYREYVMYDKLNCKIIYEQVCEPNDKYE